MRRAVFEGSRARRLQLIASVSRGGLVVRCAWCGCLMAPSGRENEERDQSVERVQHVRLAPHARHLLSHGICGPCFERIGTQAEIARVQAGRVSTREPGDS